MISPRFVVALFLAPLVLGQANNTELGIEAIEAHFSNAGLVPSLLATFNPNSLLSLSYDGVGDISPGQALTKTQVAPTPNLQVTPANSTVQLNGTFTVVMADADVVGTDESKGQTRHWLVNGATLTGSSAPLAVSTDSATVITTYAGPGPAAGSGAHRYVILLYSQPADFTAPDGLNAPGAPVAVFNLADYVQSSKLGPLIAGTYITVEEGTASVSPSSTAPVVTSTLPAAQSTATSPSSSSGSKGSSASSTSSGSSPSTTPKNQTSGAQLTAVSVFKVLLAGAISYAILGF